MTRLPEFMTHDPRPTTFTLLCLVAAACSSKEPEPQTDTFIPPAKLADMLVLKAPGSVEVWFTDSREAKDSSGKSCTERVMQIRRGETRIQVPLLYTGSVPRLVNDSTIQAPIWLNCKPGNVYQVDLTTGRPTRVK